MSMRPIGDDDLQGLVDERLDTARKREVEAYLEQALHAPPPRRVDAGGVGAAGGQHRRPDPGSGRLGSRTGQ